MPINMALLTSAASRMVVSVAADVIFPKRRADDFFVDLTVLGFGKSSRKQGRILSVAPGAPTDHLDWRVFLARFFFELN